MRTAFIVLLLAPVLAGCIGGSDAPVETAATAASSSEQLPWANGDFDTSGPFSRVLEPGPYGILPDEVVHLESELDGATIQIGIVRPDVPDGVRVPIIAMSTIYMHDLTLGPLADACRTPASGEDGHGPCRFYNDFLIENYVPHGYAVAFIPSRGTAGSGGCIDWAGPSEAADLDQAITWLAKRPWANGDLGMTGISYGAITSFMAAAQGNPHLKTIVAMSGPPGMGHLVRNGTTTVPPAQYNLHLAAYGLGLQQTPGLAAYPERACERHARFEAALAALETDPYGDPLGFWGPREYADQVAANYRGSILFAQGLPEATHPATVHPWLSELEQRGIRVHQVWGQWGHFVPDAGADSGDPIYGGNPTVRWDWAEMLLRWFDQELKGIDVEVGPHVQVADNTFQWRVEETWPPVDAERITLDLAELERTDPLAGRAPAFNSGHPRLGPRGVTFETDALGADLRLSGWTYVTLAVTPSGPGGEVAVYLRDGTADQRLGWGVLDLRYPDGATTPREVVPGERLAVTVELVPLDAFVPAGHRLQLVVDVSPPDGEPGHTALTPTQVHQEGTLVLPLIERPDDVLFTPPGGSP